MLLLDCVGSRRNPATFKLMGLDLSIQAEQNGTIKFWNLVATTCQDFGQCLSTRHPARVWEEGEKLTVGMTVSLYFEFKLCPSLGDRSSDSRRETHSTKSCDLWQWENRLFTLKCIIFKIGVCLIESFVA